MMKLFFSPGACSMSPHIVLEEVGAKYEIYKIDMKNKTLPNGEDFKKINPKGQVPTIQTEDNKVLTEGAVIVQYISDTYPQKNVLPAWGTWERTKANEWLNYIGSELHKTMGAWFGIERLYTDPNTISQVKVVTQKMTAMKFDYLDNHLKDNDFLMGKEFSAPDAYLFTVLSWHKALQMDLSKWPNLAAFDQRMKARPSVQKAMQAEGLIPKT